MITFLVNGLVRVFHKENGPHSVKSSKFSQLEEVIVLLLLAYKKMVQTSSSASADQRSSI